MVQVKKDEIRERIDAAALKVFAEKGYKGAKVSDIAALAGVSVGNIYRYYANKDDIFYSVLPEDFPAQFHAAIAEKIGSARKGLQAGSHAFQEVADAFVGFMRDHRERIIILFSGSQGTRYAHFRSEFAAALLSIVKNMYPEKYAACIARWGSDSILRMIYENLIGMYGHLLSRITADDELTEALRQINLYHFSGIMQLMNI